ncbi:ATP-binding protein [Micromonospora sp. NPDC049051]|uniref:HAMP domain-containing sensor histidine kinase n=1 Tax=Micromonospora sp. NPDC049051 TaxID=3364264 RepID=UPI003714D9A5
MNLQTPRRRLLVVCVAAFAAGYAVRILGQSLFTWFYLGLKAACPDHAVCVKIREEAHWLLPDAIAALAVVALLLLLRPVSWALRPVRDLVPVVARIGPQNLGYRTGVVSGRNDEFAALCRAIDDMMDRISTGYEGQRRFAANASHELRTPLAVQRTLIEVGMAQPLTGEQLTLLATQLLKTNERNERLVEGLLALSEADHGLVSRLPQRLDQIAASVIAAHQATADTHAVQLTSELRPRIVEGEQVLLERLVTNLVQNAIKYNHAQGTVHVTVGESPALVVNTGQIVPADAVTGLFEPLKRLAADRIAHSGGAGLGLAIARSITQAHGGTITATALDRGGLRLEVLLPGVRDGGL